MAPVAAVLVNVAITDRDATWPGLMRYLEWDQFPSTDPGLASAFWGALSALAHRADAAATGIMQMTVDPNADRHNMRVVVLTFDLECTFSRDQPWSIVTWKRENAADVPLRALVVTCCDLAPELYATQDPRPLGTWLFTIPVQSAKAILVALRACYRHAVPVQAADSGRAPCGKAGGGKGGGPAAASQASRSRARSWHLLGRVVNAALDLLEKLPDEGPIPASFWQPDIFQIDPSCLREDDMCCQWPQVGEWLTALCPLSSGRCALNNRAEFNASTWASSIVHSVKCELLDDLWPGESVPQHRTLRGWMNDVERDCFWVATDAATFNIQQFLQPDDVEAEGDDEDATWRYRLAWVINTETLLRRRNRSAESDSTAALLWRDGRVHLIERAPRTAGGMWRLRLAPPVHESIHGDVTMLVLGFAGPAAWTYAALRRRVREAAPLTGPCATLLRWTRTPTAADSLSGNAFRNTFPDEAALAQLLPEDLSTKLDAEQRAAVLKISGTESCVHFVHALAGTGKTQVVKCLLHGFHRNRQPGQYIIMALRSKVLRAEFCLDLASMLPVGSVMELGMSPKVSSGAPANTDLQLQSWEAVVQANVVSYPRFVASKERLTEAMGALVSAWPEGLSVPDVVTDGASTWRRVAHLMDCARAAAGEAMRLHWQVFLEWEEAEERALYGVSVAVTTIDVALKMFAGEVAYPGNKLFAKCKCMGLVQDEVQRTPTATLATLAACVPSLTCSGDSGQRPRSLNRSLHFRRPNEDEGEEADSQASAGQVGARIQRVMQNQMWGDQMLEQAAKKETNGGEPLVTFCTLSVTKRLGQPLVRFLKELLPKQAGKLNANASHRGTAFRHVFYNAEADGWWNLQDAFSHFNLKTAATIPAYVGKQVVWHRGLFEVLAASVFQQLLVEATMRREVGLEDPVFVAEEPVVFVGFALRRLFFPFRQLMVELLTYGPLLQRLGLETAGIGVHTVSCRLGNDSTGPTFLYGHVVRHPRYRERSQVTYRAEAPKDVANMQLGDQADESLLYIQLSRASRDTAMWMHTFPFGTPGEPRTPGLPSTTPPSLNAHRKHVHTVAPHFDWQRIDLDNEAERLHWRLHDMGHAARFWNAEQAQLLALDVDWFWAAPEGREKLRPALLELVRVLLRSSANMAQNMESLPETPLLAADLHQAKRVRRDMPTARPPPSLGVWALPRDPLDVIREQRGALPDVLWSLGPRLVDGLTIRPGGKVYAVTAIPVLDPYPGGTRIPYALDQNADNNKPQLEIMAIVLLTWAAYVAELGNTAQPLMVLGVPHKASVVEGGGLEWWTRGCSCDRVAVVLISLADALELIAAAEHSMRPPRPKKPLLYAYLGGGVSGQPDEVSGIVVRTKDLALNAALASAVGLISATWPGNIKGAEFDVQLVAADPDAPSPQVFADFVRFFPQAAGRGASVRRQIEHLLDGVLGAQPVGMRPWATDITPERMLAFVVAGIDLSEESLPAEEVEPTPEPNPDATCPRRAEPEMEPGRVDGDPPFVPQQAGQDAEELPNWDPPTDNEAVPEGPCPAPAIAAVGGDAATTGTAKVMIGLVGILWPRDARPRTIDECVDMGSTHRARQWVKTLVGRIGAENVFIVNVGTPATTAKWARVLRQSGFMEETGFQGKNFVGALRYEDVKGLALQRACTRCVLDNLDGLRPFLAAEGPGTFLAAEGPGNLPALPPLWLVPSWEYPGGASFSKMASLQQLARAANVRFAVQLSAVPLEDLVSSHTQRLPSQ